MSLRLVLTEITVRGPELPVLEAKVGGVNLRLLPTGRSIIGFVGQLPTRRHRLLPPPGVEDRMLITVDNQALFSRWAVIFSGSHVTVPLRNVRARARKPEMAFDALRPLIHMLNNEFRLVGPSS